MRVTLDSTKLTRAIQARGLQLSDLACATGLALATVSAAASGRRVNIATALALTRAVNSRPVVPELEALLECKAVSEEGNEVAPPAPDWSRPTLRAAGTSSFR